jgi:hypothetical protein
MQTTTILSLTADLDYDPFVADDVYRYGQLTLKIGPAELAAIPMGHWPSHRQASPDDEQVAETVAGWLKGVLGLQAKLIAVLSSETGQQAVRADDPADDVHWAIRDMLRRIADALAVSD